MRSLSCRGTDLLKIELDNAIRYNKNVLKIKDPAVNALQKEEADIIIT